MLRRSSFALGSVVLATLALAFAPPLAHAKGKAPKKAPAAETESEPETTEAAETEPPKTDDEPAAEGEENATEKTDEASAPSDTAEDEAPKTEETEEATPPPAPAPQSYARLWLGVSGVVDIAFLPTGNDVCRLNPDGTIMNSIQVFCTDPEGRDFPIRGNFRQNELMPLNGAGKLDGGPVLGDVRFLFVLEYAVTPFLLAGVRAGYVANSYEGASGLGDRPEWTRHLHGELRVTYLFGDAPLSRVGFAPLAFFAAGAGQFDGHERTNIRYTGIRASDPVEAWAVSGPLFVTLGGGARYQFSRRAAFSAAARGNLSFGPQGTLLTAGPEVTFLYGF